MTVRDNAEEEMDETEGEGDDDLDDGLLLLMMREG